METTGNHHYWYLIAKQVTAVEDVWLLCHLTNTPLAQPTSRPICHYYTRLNGWILRFKQWAGTQL